MIRFAKGPDSKLVSKEDALTQLKSHPSFPKDAEVEVTDIGGHWVAAIAQADWTRLADNPFGGPNDQNEESPSPKSEGPDDSEPSPDKGPSDDGGDSDGDSDDGEGGPPKEHKEHGEGGGDKAVLHELLDIVTQMAQALGIAPPGGPAEGMVPGEGEMAPPPPGPPGPPGGPPHGGPHGAPPGGPDQTVQHQRALKPGEAPPGTTPVGAPAFASTVPDNHPWKDQIGKVATFTVKHEIPLDEPVSKVASELDRIAYGTGFKVKQIKADTVDGKRIARALISAY